MGEGQYCYIDELTSIYADNMGTQVQQEEAETAALEQAAAEFLTEEAIRYGFAASDKATLEDLQQFICDDGDLADQINRIGVVMLRVSCKPNGSAERDNLLSQAAEMQDELTRRAAFDMLKPHVGYFMELDTIAA